MLHKLNKNEMVMYNRNNSTQQLVKIVKSI